MPLGNIFAPSVTTPFNAVVLVTVNAPGIATAPVVPVMPMAFVSTPPLFMYKSKFLLLVPFLMLISPELVATVRSDPTNNDPTVTA